MEKAVSDTLLHSLSGKQWEKIGVRHHHGIVAPLFSLHTRESCGIGEYFDLLPLIEWCSKLGLDVIQMLPLNDTGHDTSPYGAISAFALHPIYLSLSRLPYIENYPNLQQFLLEMQQLTNTQRINYPLVIAAKERFLQQYYLHASHHLMPSYDYQQFVQQNNDWLLPYALFKALKMENQWHHWEDWDHAARHPDDTRYRSLLLEYANEIQYHIFVQYLCFQQWRVVRSEAESKGVFLKGDIPILINRDSADVWHNRSLFLLQYSAGAPPDMYAEDGQNWGFPVYNWKEMEKSSYNWWKRRLSIAERLYQIYRLDHIVGFFRVWGIPVGQHGRNGFFIPQEEALWIPQGEKIMTMMLENCSALPIGEDLGTVPPYVRQFLSVLGISGTRVMRWERVWNEDKRFIPFAGYIPESMTTVSTHDSETLHQWWKNNPSEAKDYAQFKGWTYAPELTPEQHKEILFDSHHTSSLFHINPLPEYLAAVQGMTWPKLDDERINVPGTITDTNWTYRTLPSVDEIVTSEPLKQVIQQAIS